ncbi:ABC transporter substrate-binding protein [Paracoccus albus]|uniref:ABC transporter substrate-binding protein n=1 Tax=Paracoccus albus TaxID=3017784 RepID=UPI0022F0C7BA|nr:ABC transporter substrate-binding protein [Paracoccus albus]WBU60779.1 ABC transporter substrate-binding protein [Paracoccus albus]
MFQRWTITTAAIALLTTPALAQQDGITLGMVLEPPSLDPTGNAAAAIDEIVYSNVFEGLTKFAPDGTIQPALASSWDVEDDGKTYIFHLQEGVKFHDGADFNAEDVVFSLDRARADDSTNPQKTLFEGIETVEAVDPVTVRITLSAADGMFPFKMAWGDAVMLDEASVANEATQPVGTGPFQFGEWRQGDSIRLDAFEGYWGDKPALKTATFRFIGDPTAAFAAIMAGDVDAFPIFPSTETLAQLEADPRFKVIVGTTEGETILTMNKAVPPLDNVQVREAIAHAVNRQEIIDGAMFGYGTPIGTHFAPHHPDYVDLTEQSAYDPERAKELLAEAGIEDLTLRLALPPTPYARRGGELLAAQLRAVGIETEATNMEWAQWLETVYTGKDYDLTIISHVEPMDIGIYVRDDYYFNYSNDELKEVLAEANSTTDDARRSELLKQAQTIIADDYANGYLFQLAKTGVANAKIEGLWENSPTPANDLSQVRWTE